MQIQIQRVNEAVHLKATNDQGNVVLVDGSEKIGGQNLGVRPMQLLLVALGSCASMDVLSILKKQRQEVDEYEVLVDGIRDEEKVPSLFKSIHITFLLKGDLDIKKVQRAIDLSINTYCSVSKTLEKTATITSSFKINDNEEQSI